MRFARLLLCPLIAAFASGCYSYVPTRLETIDPGASVRLQITAVAVDRLEPMRFTNSPAVEGTIVGKNEQGLDIDAIIRTVDAMGITAMHTQRLSMALDDVQSISYRRLDRVRTGAAVGGLAFVLGAAVYIVLYGDLGSIDEFEPELEFRAPLLRIPIGPSR